MPYYYRIYAEDGRVLTFRTLRLAIEWARDPVEPPQGIVGRIMLLADSNDIVNGVDGGSIVSLGGAVIVKGIPPPVPVWVDDWPLQPTVVPYDDVELDRMSTTVADNRDPGSCRSSTTAVPDNRDSGSNGNSTTVAPDNRDSGGYLQSHDDTSPTL
jgi:hypothetical protein